ncbi:tetratricopeptide repeat protein [Flavobacterium sp.]|uniref:tetratricopeptide repeat protein n=1 Tax=Flavobacterium sp. TaxID=239 RepID=UPI003D2CE952
MKHFKTIAFFFLLVTLSNQQVIYGQINPDDIALVENEVENNFYKALKQRGIENYDKAIVAIQKCIEKDNTNPVFYHELGKNHLDLKQYLEAENAFKKAIELNPNERWYLNSLYDVYYQTKDFLKSIPIVQKLISFDPNMSEDLVSLYMYTNQHDKALNLLNEMESTSVLSQSMEYYKLKIQSSNANSKPEVKELENLIRKNPKVEQNYIDLMMLYSTSNQEEKAFEVAKELAKEIPNSDWAHVSLFKFYLVNNEVSNAKKSMFKVFNNKNIDLRIKHRILNEFLIVTVNTNEHDKDLEEAVSYFANDNIINVPKEIGKFFYNKKEYLKTELYLKKGIQNEPNDIESVLLLLEVESTLEKFEDVKKIATNYIDLFPTFSKLYFYAGLANYNLNNTKAAISQLEMGLEFIIEDAVLENQFYLLLAESFKKENNTTKEKIYRSKAELIQKNFK